MTEVHGQIEQRDARIELATALYVALKKSGELHEHTVLRYRHHQHRCSLLDVIDAPQGNILGFWRYKTSPPKTEAGSTESGRRKNTEDGDHHWKPQAYFMGDLTGVLLLNCDHLEKVPLAFEELTADLDAGYVLVMVRSDGTRYAVH